MSCCLRHARLLAGVLLLVLLGGCSQLIPRETLPGDLPDVVELADTPFFAQERYQCGPAALAMVLGQRGLAVTPDELVARVYLPERQGSVAPEMVATARSYGMLVYELPPTLDALLREVAAGSPVLVLQNLGLSWLPKWHYAVVVGYDLGAQHITLRSGTIERHQVSLALFDRTWQRGKRWGITLLRPGELPAGSAHLNYMKGAYALEQTAQFDAALAAYHSACRRWPGETLSWLALANLQYLQGRYTEAADTLQLAIVHHPAAAQLWNNLGYALAGAGCGAVGLEAVECAIRLAPEEVGYLQSREELAAQQRAVATECPVLSCPLSLQ